MRISKKNELKIIDVNLNFDGLKQKTDSTYIKVFKFSS